MLPVIRAVTEGVWSCWSRGTGTFRVGDSEAGLVCFLLFTGDSQPGMGQGVFAGDLGEKAT